MVELEAPGLSRRTEELRKGQVRPPSMALDHVDTSVRDTRHLGKKCLEMFSYLLPFADGCRSSDKSNLRGFHFKGEKDTPKK